MAPPHPLFVPHEAHLLLQVIKMMKGWKWFEMNIGKEIMSLQRLVWRSVCLENAWRPLSVPLIPFTGVRKYENTHMQNKSAGKFKE